MHPRKSERKCHSVTWPRRCGQLNINDLKCEHFTSKSKKADYQPADSSAAVTAYHEVNKSSNQSQGLNEEGKEEERKRETE